MKKGFRWLKVIIIVYCVIGIVLYYMQDTFLFHPVALDKNYQYKFSDKFDEVNIPVNKEDTISLIRFKSEASIKKGVVIYFHGNMKNVEHYSANASRFLVKGYDVWMPDYPGYGKTTGERTEKKMYEQADIVMQMAVAVYPADSILIYGKSLGTGIAAYVSSHLKTKALILETPYYSMTSLFSHYAFIYPVHAMVKYKLPLFKYLQQVQSPVLIFHGSGDNIIPYSNSIRLQPLLKSNDKFITIDGGGHNNLNKYAEFNNTLDSLLNL